MRRWDWYVILWFHSSFYIKSIAYNPPDVRFTVLWESFRVPWRCVSFWLLSTSFSVVLVTALFVSIAASQFFESTLTLESPNLGRSAPPDRIEIYTSNTRLTSCKFSVLYSTYSWMFTSYFSALLVRKTDLISIVTICQCPMAWYLIITWSIIALNCSSRQPSLWTFYEGECLFSGNELSPCLITDYWDIFTQNGQNGETNTTGIMPRNRRSINSIHRHVASHQERGDGYFCKSLREVTPKSWKGSLIVVHVMLTRTYIFICVEYVGNEVSKKARWTTVQRTSVPLQSTILQSKIWCSDTHSSICACILATIVKTSKHTLS